MTAEKAKPIVVPDEAPAILIVMVNEKAIRYVPASALELARAAWRAAEEACAELEGELARLKAERAEDAADLIGDVDLRQLKGSIGYLVDAGLLTSGPLGLIAAAKSAGWNPEQKE
jgi:hypothetical protein